MNDLTTRAGFAAVIGAPNAGKSTLVNRLVGSKVTIVTRKVQTTRFPVRGVAMEGDSQVILVDTPGVFTPRRRLDRAMVRSAWTGAEEADAVMHVFDVIAEIAAEDGKGSSADRFAVDDAATIIAGLKASGRKAILVLNKIDGAPKERLLGLSKRLFDEGVDVLHHDPLAEISQFDHDHDVVSGGTAACGLRQRGEYHEFGVEAERGELDDLVDLAEHR